mmetsp:Transcript_11839/g.31937  ORF Transcript_11839/g.31937 Transcript_11839/m.31937 type:complete len:238 (+) Transcript_11839:1410-2123(+)
MPVEHLESLRVHHYRELLSATGIVFLLMLLLEPLNELLTALVLQRVSAAFPETLCLELFGGPGSWFIAACLLLYPSVLQGGRGRKASRLVLFDEAHRELTAFRRAKGRQLGMFRLDIGLVLEREATIHQTVHDHAQSPHIDLEPIAHGVEFGWPVNLRAAVHLQPFVFAFHLVRRPEIAQRHNATWVTNILAICEVIVTLDISVDNQMGMQVVERKCHLPSDVDDFVWRDFTFRLPV